MGTELRLDDKVLEMGGGDGCSTLPMCLMPPTWTLKVVKKANLSF